MKAQVVVDAEVVLKDPRKALVEEGRLLCGMMSQLVAVRTHVLKGNDQRGDSDVVAELVDGYWWVYRSMMGSFAKNSVVHDLPWWDHVENVVPSRVLCPDVVVLCRNRMMRCMDGMNACDVAMEVASVSRRRVVMSAINRLRFLWEKEMRMLERSEPMLKKMLKGTGVGDE